MNPPPSQAMTADPSVVAPAVRVCDDILLASPTLTFMPAMQSNAHLPKTNTIPIANSAGVEVLTCIVEVLSEGWERLAKENVRVIMEWNGSIVTAEGVCVARVWRKFDRKKNFGNPKHVSSGAARTLAKRRLVYGGLKR